MKKYIKMLGAVVLAAACFAGCGALHAPAESGADNVSVVCTTFPQYDWVMNLLGEGSTEFDVSLLVKNSADIHNYQPSAQDMISMKEADLFIYVGGESDAWVTDLMQADPSLSEKSISLVGALGDEALDEHVWLSLENAEILCQYISAKLEELVPKQADTIKENTKNYLSKLHELNDEYQDMIDASAKKTLIFGDRFPFCYLAEDYNLAYYAAFEGCNAEVEVNFDTVIHLAGKADELQVPCILVIDGSDKSLAQAILNAAEDSRKEILVLNSMQSVSLEDMKQGTNYLDIMRANLEVLRKALD